MFSSLEKYDEPNEVDFEEDLETFKKDIYKVDVMFYR